MVKARMTTTDVAAEVKCLRRLIGMRLANVYDITPKVSRGPRPLLLLPFANRRRVSGYAANPSCRRRPRAAGWLVVRDRMGRVFLLGSVDAILYWMWACSDWFRKLCVGVCSCFS